MKITKLTILIGISLLAIVLSLLNSRSEPSQYIYKVDVNMDGQHKVWKYIEPSEYKVKLQNGDSIQITVTTNSPLDVSEIRFYNTCSTLGTASGKFYITVNGVPALPTIGLVPLPSPIYISSPMCPTYGTTNTFVFDTPDTTLPTTRYNFRYEGNEIQVKTIEMYAVRKPN